ncbi:MAG: hypothetical protein NUV78_03395, partial [Candidatus Zambryskibacteria bacterium]|nr:hypothetical protein [Candidatus Zambryskibacteria bacterium]
MVSGFLSRFRIDDLIACGIIRNVDTRSHFVDDQVVKSLFARISESHLTFVFVEPDCSESPVFRWIDPYMDSHTIPPKNNIPLAWYFVKVGGDAGDRSR